MTALPPDGQRVVSASYDGSLKVWDLASGRLIATLQGHAGKVLACAASPDGRRVISASDDRMLKVWDLTSGQPVATLQGHAGKVLACAVTPDGRCAVSASDDTMLKVWDLVSGQPIATLQGHAAGVSACAVTPDGQRAISASEDRTLKVWDLVSGHPVVTLQGHRLGVTACAVTPDGRRVVSASYDTMLTVWDLESGQPVTTWRGHDGFVLACAVTPDGRHVVSASEDRTLKLWDIDSGQPVARLHGHASFVTACAVTPDGQRVVSASCDRTLKVWDLASGQPIASLHGHASFVAACAVIPDVVSDDQALGAGPGDGNRRRPPGSHDHREKHTILFAAANPLDTDQSALHEECAAIQHELRASPHRDGFDFRSEWAVSVDELMRHLNELQPTILHFSGRGSTGAAGEIEPTRSAGILLQEERRPQHVSEHALARMIESAAPATRVVVLNACHSAAIAESLRHVVGCVVAMDGAIGDATARSFAAAFYRALGNHRSVGNAVAQAVATLAAKCLPGHLVVCRTRDGLSADQIFLHASDPDPVDTGG